MLWILLASVLWSLDGVLRTQVRHSLAPSSILFFEHLIGALLLVGLCIFIPKLRPTKIKCVSDFKTFIFLGSLSSVVATLFYTSALAQSFFIPISLVVLLQKLQPLWALLGARWINKEPIPLGFLRWAACALMGSFLISFPEFKIHWNTQNPQSLAVLLGLSASVIWGLSTCLGRQLSFKYSAFEMTFYRILFGLCAALVLFLTLPFAHEWQLKHLAFALSAAELQWPSHWLVWINLLVIVIFTGLGALWIYYVGLKKTPARKATFYELGWPISALVIDLFYNINQARFEFRPELLHPVQILGIALLFAGLIKVSQSQRGAS